MDKQQNGILRKLHGFLSSSRNVNVGLENVTWLVGVLMKVSVELSTIMNRNTDRHELPEVAAHLRLAVGSGGRTGGGKTARKTPGGKGAGRPGAEGEGAAFSVVAASGKGMRMLGTAIGGDGGTDGGNELTRAADDMATGPLHKAIRAVVKDNNRG